MIGRYVMDRSRRSKQRRPPIHRPWPYTIDSQALRYFVRPRQRQAARRRQHRRHHAAALRYSYSSLTPQQSPASHPCRQFCDLGIARRLRLIRWTAVHDDGEAAALLPRSALMRHPRPPVNYSALRDGGSPTALSRLLGQCPIVASLAPTFTTFPGPRSSAASNPARGHDFFRPLGFHHPTQKVSPGKPSPRRSDEQPSAIARNPAKLLGTLTITGKGAARSDAR